MNPIVLAFIGDAVYSLYTRQKTALSCDCKAGELQKITSKTVSAVCQSSAVGKILPILTADEHDIYMRARNAKKGTKSKSSTAADYNRSTGFEAVVGYLYLTGDYFRLKNLISAGDDHDN